jgi:hypothetical protein
MVSLMKLCSHWLNLYCSLQHRQEKHFVNQGVSCRDRLMVTGSTRLSSLAALAKPQLKFIFVCLFATAPSKTTRAYLPNSFLLQKHVAGKSGSLICRCKLVALPSEPCQLSKQDVTFSKPARVGGRAKNLQNGSSLSFPFEGSLRFLHGLAWFRRHQVE